MTGTSLVPLDVRQPEELARDLRAAARGYLPAWDTSAGRPGGALVEIAARLLGTIVRRLNEVPSKNRLALLELLGVELLSAQAARVPIVFRLGAKAGDVRAPAGTRVAAPPPVDSTQQLVFETERTTDLTAGTLAQVVSLWPGRDQYIDHSAAAVARTPFRPWELKELEDIPHHLYVRHDTLLALKGQARILVRFDLTTPSSRPMEVLWEYWDGEDWRGFEYVRPGCDEEKTTQDGTDGLRRSGTYVLTSDCAEAQQATVHGVTGFWIRGRLDEPLPPDPAHVLPDVDQIAFETEVKRLLEYETDTDPEPAVIVGIKSGLLPDAVLAGVLPTDPTQPFQPFGPQPQPGATLYLKSDEALGTPRAEVRLLIAWDRRFPNMPNVKVSDVQDVSDFEVLWEYWNGHLWVSLGPVTVDGDDLFDGVVETDDPPDSLWTTYRFEVPEDLSPTTVNDEDGHWLRARLIRGDFAVTVDVGTREFPNTFPVTVPPVVTHIRLGYAWRQGPFPPTTVLTYNDFRFAARTDEATLPGPTFQPFTSSTDRTPALYLGFDKPPPRPGRIGILFDVLEDPADTDGPVLLWEYFDGIAWRRLSAEEETHGFRIPGIAAVITEQDDRPLVRFDIPLAPHPLSWIRARLAEDGPPGAPLVNAIHPNAEWAVQVQTIVDEPLGTSSGEPSQTFAFRQVPVLAGTQVAVREVVGRRANVEWRQVAAELFAGDVVASRSLETQLAAEGPQTDVAYERLLLKRDRLKRVTEVWVQWEEKITLFLSGPNDRHYVVDRARGRLTFGDALRGKVPPPGAAVLARRYRSGGGRAGNVAAKLITQLLGPASGIESVENPLPAEGGADGEPLANVAERGPRTLRHRGRAVTPEDYETLAYEAAPDLGWARAIACRDRAGHVRPGWVTLLVIPQSEAPRPMPSFGLRERIRKHIEARAGADLAATHHVQVAAPRYFPIDVEATIVAVDPAETGAVVARAREALERFLHPLRGGPTGRGWELGRDVFLSDVARVLEHVMGLDYVRELALFAQDTRRAERADIPDGMVVVVGELRLTAEGA